MKRGPAAQAALALGALGVVFGDIGTSPLYTLQTAFNPGDPHPVKPTSEAIFGICSLIFWSVTLIVTVTYVLLVMRADNDGEGGIMALITLIKRRGVSGGRRTKVALAMLGVFGASLFFGDSLITPAISVLSAVEGVNVAAPSLSSAVVPITAAIIVCLFLAQTVYIKTHLLNRGGQRSQFLTKLFDVGCVLLGLCLNRQQLLYIVIDLPEHDATL